MKITTTALLAKDTMIQKLRDALVKEGKVEIWEINLAEAGTVQNKYKATYYQGYVTEFEKTSGAEDYVECSLTFGVEGTGADGEVTLTVEQQEMIELYGFKDIAKEGE